MTYKFTCLNIIRGDGCGKGGRKAMPLPPNFLDIVKRTKAEKYNLLVVAPQIFGPSTVSDDY